MTFSTRELHGGPDPSQTAPAPRLEAPRPIVCPHICCPSRFSTCPIRRSTWHSSSVQSRCGRRSLRRTPPRLTANGEAAPGRHPDAFRLARPEPSGPLQSGKLRARPEVGHQTGQDPGADGRAGAATPGLHRHHPDCGLKGPGYPGGDGLQLRPCRGRRGHERR